MKNRNTYKYLLFLLPFYLVSCVTHWTDAIQQGSIESGDINQVVDFTFENNLIIVPVQVNGKTYRFLLDTGAMTSISKEVQAEFQFKIISKGKLTDSDKSKSTVNYVQVKSMNVGGISFKNQTAFVSDLSANPILDCMNLDGILGSNTMRLCNWEFNFQKEQFVIHNNSDFSAPKNAAELPFKTDKQYDIMIPVGVGANKVRNLKLDTGSNGGLTIPVSIFNTLSDNKRFTSVFTETGKKQSGLFGKAVAINRKLTYTDSIAIKGLAMKDVEIKTGTSGLIGNEILSRFELAINWKKRVLYFVPTGLPTSFNATFGVSIGMNKNGVFYIQAIIEESTAFQKGIRVGMTVLEINGLKLNDPSVSYCDYFQLMLEKPNQLNLKLQDAIRAEMDLNLNKETLSN
ncbi:MAG: aspartyl protease family protein [Flavobacteriaceae bacterium]|nr:aspartyl protease family protein [Flavobacteriaceae bacterium]